jgi:hypothetical protein
LSDDDEEDVVDKRDEVDERRDNLSSPDPGKGRLKDPSLLLTLCPQTPVEIDRKYNDQCVYLIFGR